MDVQRVVRVSIMPAQVRLRPVHVRTLLRVAMVQVRHRRVRRNAQQVNTLQQDLQVVQTVVVVSIVQKVLLLV